MKNVLITGANGLVGYAIAKKMILNSDIHLWCAYHKNVSEILGNRIQINLQNEYLTDVGIDFDCIVHCAALIPSNTVDISIVADTNRKIDDNIIEYAKNKNCLLIYLSSTAVYGEILDKVNEETTVKIRNSYAEEKRRSEVRIINECGKYYILRLSSPYGLRMKQKNVLKIFITNALNREPIRYFGSGKRTQNFTHVDDIGDFCLKCLECNKYGVYNVASYTDISMRELGELIADETKNICGQEVQVMQTGMVDAQENIRNMIDIDKAIRDIGWKPKVMLREGVRELIYEWGKNKM